MTTSPDHSWQNRKNHCHFLFRRRIERYSPTTEPGWSKRGGRRVIAMLLPSAARVLEAGPKGRGSNQVLQLRSNPPPGYEMKKSYKSINCSTELDPRCAVELNRKVEASLMTRAPRTSIATPDFFLNMTSSALLGINVRDKLKSPGSTDKFRGEVGP